MPSFIPIVTTTLGASPGMAADVISGLNARIYERVGGVVRDASTKRVVTFLRDIASNANPSVLSPLLPINAAASVLNLSITSAGFAIVMQRLQVVEQKLVAISKQLEGIGRKLDLNYFANLRAAIELVRTAFAMNGEGNRQIAATQAINRLLEVEHLFVGLIDMEFDNGGWTVLPLLNSVMLATVSASRCYLELDELETAQRHLDENQRVIHDRVKKFYDTIIGVNPAVFLHPRLAEQISLTRIARLRRCDQPNLTDAQVFESLRHQFWEAASQAPDSWVQKLPASLWNHAEDGEKKLGPVRMRRSTDEIYERLLPRLGNAFSQVEEAYESLGRVCGFEAELSFLRESGIRYADWQQLQLEAVSDGDEIVCLLPDKSPLLSSTKSLAITVPPSSMP